MIAPAPTFADAVEITQPPKAVTLLDTRHSFDAGLLGYEGHADPREDGQGLIVDRLASGWFRLEGPEGEIEMTAHEARQVALTILKAVGQ